MAYTPSENERGISNRTGTEGVAGRTRRIASSSRKATSTQNSESRSWKMLTWIDLPLDEDAMVIHDLVFMETDENEEAFDHAMDDYNKRGWKRFDYEITMPVSWNTGKKELGSISPVPLLSIDIWKGEQSADLDFHFFVENQKAKTIYSKINWNMKLEIDRMKRVEKFSETTKGVKAVEFKDGSSYESYISGHDSIKGTKIVGKKGNKLLFEDNLSVCNVEQLNRYAQDGEEVVWIGLSGNIELNLSVFSY